jgi:photosystem II stability/assembly factor-like uncharacterized protein
MKKLIFLLPLLFLFSKVYSQTSGWQWQNPKPSGSWLFSSYFFDAQNGLAVGSDGAIHKTSDGGQNWVLKSSGTKRSLNKVFFINSQVGWIAGSEGTLLKTTDAGSTWTLIPTGIQIALTQIYFVDSQKGWMAGDGWNGISGQIWLTSNGGNS